MWALALFTHPESDFLFYKPEQRKKAIVNSLKIDLRYLNNKHLITKFVESTMSYPEQRLIFWRTELEGIDKLLKKFPAEDLEGLEERAKILLTFGKLWEAYRKAESEFIKQDKEKIHGGAEESAFEAGKV